MFVFVQSLHVHAWVCFFCRECYENNGLYHALQLETMFNINSFLNRTVVSVIFLCMTGTDALKKDDRQPVNLCAFHHSTTKIWPKC